MGSATVAFGLPAPSLPTRFSLFLRHFFPQTLRWLPPQIGLVRHVQEGRWHQLVAIPLGDQRGIQRAARQQSPFDGPGRSASKNHVFHPSHLPVETNRCTLVLAGKQSRLAAPIAVLPGGGPPSSCAVECEEIYSQPIAVIHDEQD